MTAGRGGENYFPMDLIGRYLFKQVFTAFIASLVTLTGIVWLTQVLREIGALTVQGQSVGVFLALTLLVLPLFVSVIAPLAVFIATLYTLNRLNADSELVVLSAAGAARWHIIAPFLVLSLLVAVFVGYINIHVMPQSLSMLRLLVTEVRTDLIANVIQPGRFSSPENGITLHIRARNSDGELLGLLINDARDPKQELTYLAERGRIVETSDGTYLVMDRGNVQRRATDGGEQVQIVRFDRYLVDLEQLSQTSKEIYYKPREQSTAFLLNPDPDDAYYKLVPGRFRSELHARLASPLFPPLLAMIALATVGFARTTREGRGSGMMVAVVAAVVCQIAIYSTYNLAVKYAWAAALIYIVPLSALAYSSLVAFGMLRPRLDGRWAGAAGDGLGWVTGRAQAAMRTLAGRT